MFASPTATREVNNSVHDATWTARDQAIVDQAEPSLAVGRELKRWWKSVDGRQAYAEKFPLVRTFNRPDDSFGFFDLAPTTRGEIPVMGDVQSMFYDQPKGAGGGRWREEVREFVLRYFMRVSDFRPPAAVAVRGRAAPPWLAALSWCPDEGVEREGFGYTQLYFKRSADGHTGKFSEQQQFAISDLRDLGPKYAWIICRVRIFDFDIRFRPFGVDGPELAVPLKEDTYVVLAPDLVSDLDHPEPGVHGEYGIGYTVFPDPFASGLLAYGPGKFAAGFQLITFRVLQSGETRADLVFVVNRPEKLFRTPVDPLTWPFRFADALTFGLSARFLAPAQRLAESPILDGLTLLNSVTGEWLDREFCISREQLESTMLVQHFMQHYQMITGSLLTWRQVANWLDENTIPQWVRSGISS
jgi:hypothetical protein